MSECQQCATNAVTIAPRWKHLWRQHGITGGTYWPVFDLRICLQTAKSIVLDELRTGSKLYRVYVAEPELSALEIDVILPLEAC